MAKKKYYAVVRGRKPGIYTNWPDAQKQVKGFAGARFKGFVERSEAEEWLAGGHEQKDSRISHKKGGGRKNSFRSGNGKKQTQQADITLYTDGGAINNPGPGGWGVVAMYDQKLEELAGGFRRTTNNRMELFACIKALSHVENLVGSVLLYSDSSYVVNGIEKGWAKKWRANNWTKSDKQPALNSDLWAQLLELVENRKDISFVWVKGHAGNTYNERCDVLANGKAREGCSEIDDGFE